MNRHSFAVFIAMIIIVGGQVRIEEKKSGDGILWRKVSLQWNGRVRILQRPVLRLLDL